MKTERLIIDQIKETDKEDYFINISHDKRLRNARKHLENTGIGTKSQQALQRQREEMKTERRQINREEREAEAQRRFEMKQVKKKEKRRGH